MAELARRYGVSEMTIRRDLEHLERKGLVRRVHGGAVPAGPRGTEPPYAVRALRRQAAKQAVGRHVAALVEPGETVLIDAGTTTVEVARALADRERLTVVALSLQVTTLLADRPGIRLLTPGGEPRPGELMYVGEITRRTLEELRFDTYVMSIGGITVEDGLTEFCLDDTAVKRAALASSRRVILAADSSKVGQVAFSRVAGLDAVDLLVTDAALAAEDRDRLAEAGLRVEIAGGAAG